MIKHNILSNCQFGFKTGYSTYMNLTILIDKIISPIDKGEHIIGLVLEFTKAFHTVNHHIKKTKPLWNTRNSPPVVSKLVENKR